MLRASTLLLVLLLLSACSESTSADGECRIGKGFSYSFSTASGGAPTPVAAVEQFEDSGAAVSVPDGGWSGRERDESGILVGSEDVRLHVIRGEDDGWHVDSGYECA